jgi:twinkle protein
MDLREIINKYIPDAQLIGKNYHARCLWCNGGDHLKSSMVIDYQEGTFTCNRKNSCGVSGNLYTLKEKLGIDTKPKYIYQSKKQFKPIKKDLIVQEKEINFFKDRCIKNETVKYFKIYLGKYNNEDALCFPYFYQGKLANIKYRLKNKDFRQEKDPYSTLWNIDNIDYSKELIIVEGEMDCLSLYQYGMKNVVSVPCGVSNLNWIDNNWEELEQLNSIILALDNDKAGNEAVENISKRLGKHRCKRMIFGKYKDANEACMDGYSDCLREIIKVEDMKPTYIAKTTDFINEGLSRRNNPDYARGFQSAFALERDGKKFNGYRKGAVTIWSAFEGRGKTTMVFNEMCYQMVFNKCNVCIASLETDPVSWLEKILRQLKGDNVQDDEYNILMNWLSDKLSIINFRGMIEPNDLFECFEYAAKRFGITHFVIDNLMRINLDLRDGYKGHKEFINKICAFSQTYGTHVHLVCHQKKPNDNIKIPKPKVSGILGSSELANAVDNVFLVHKIEDEEAKESNTKFNAALRIGKQREGGDCFNIKLHFFKKSETFDKDDKPRLDKYLIEIESEGR